MKDNAQNVEKYDKIIILYYQGDGEDIDDLIHYVENFEANEYLKDKVFKIINTNQSDPLDMNDAPKKKAPKEYLRHQMFTT